MMEIVLALKVIFRATAIFMAQKAEIMITASCSLFIVQLELNITFN